MIAIDEAIAIIEQAVPPPRVEEVALAEAAGRVLAEAVQAPEPSPRYDNSAMDGYAVRYDDVAGCTRQRPAALRLVGESQAGIPFDGRLGAGEAVRISTGAVVPAGADTVAPVEETEEEGGAVRILACSQRGQHVRFQGEEFEAGAKLLPVGTRLAAPQLALLASVGIGRVQVFRRPRIGLLVTGTELVAPPGTEIAGYQIRDTNTLMLTTAVTAAGGAVVACHRVGDDRAATAAAVASAAAEADIVLSTGGVSVGRHDHLREAVLAGGFTERFWRVWQKPGKPLLFAYQGDRLLFGLPGNPVSAYMCFVYYVRPVIATLAGLPGGRPTVTAQAAETIENRGRRPTLMRVRSLPSEAGGLRIGALERQGSHMLTSLTGAAGYVLLQPGQRIAAGEQVQVFVW